MLRRLLSSLRRRLKGTLERGLLRPSDIIRNPYLSAKYLPFQEGRDLRALLPEAEPAHPGDDGLPVPPRPYWMGYGSSAGEYLSSGRGDAARMLQEVEAAVPGFVAGRVLDLGCGAGRMLRAVPLPRGVEGAERWGLDINAPAITWCQENLSPPMLFATTTTLPHLPFEDGYFDLVYCGSVFTHMLDLADAWLLEIRRVLRRGGLSYVTIHDRSTIEALNSDGEFSSSGLRRQLEEAHARTGILSRDFRSFSLGTEPDSQVFFDAPYFARKVGRIGRVLAIRERAYGYQTAVLWQKS